MWTQGYGVTLNAGKCTHQKASPLWGWDVHALHLCSRGHAEVSSPISSHLCLCSLQSTGTRQLEPFLLPGLLSEFSFISSHIKVPGSESSLGCCCLRETTGVSWGFGMGRGVLTCNHMHGGQKMTIRNLFSSAFTQDVRSNLSLWLVLSGSSAFTY